MTTTQGSHGTASADSSAAIRTEGKRGLPSRERKIAESAMGADRRPYGVVLGVLLLAAVAGSEDAVRPPRLRAFWSPRSSEAPPYPTATIQKVELSTEVVGIINGVVGKGTEEPREDRSVEVPAIVVPANNGSRSKPPVSRGWLRREAWALPLLCISGFCLICMGSFEIWVLWEWRRRPLASSRRHLFLGQALLIGLLASTALAGVVSLVPTPTTCGAVRLGAGLAPALVFSALLVKCVFLLSLNGGVYLPAPYQASLLLFAVLVQAAIGIQWLVQHPPAVLQIFPTPLPPLSPLISKDHRTNSLGPINKTYVDGMIYPPHPADLLLLRSSSPSPSRSRTRRDGGIPSSPSSVVGRASVDKSSARERLMVHVDTFVDDKWMPRSERKESSGERARVAQSGKAPPRRFRPSVESSNDDPFTACSAPYPHLLLSLCYVACLAVAVSAASARCRRVRENRRESLYICAASLLSLPVSLAWALAGLALPPRHRDAALAAGLLATSAAVFAVMFLPRGRRMAAVGRATGTAASGGMAVPRYGRGLTMDDDDDEDDDGSISRSPSAIYGARYSPSFFHFKPGGTTTKGHAPVGDGTSPSHVYKLPPSLIPSVFGDRVALVAGPLPSHLSPPNLHSHLNSASQALAPPQPMPLLPPPMYYPRVYHCYPYPIYPHHLHQSKSNHLSRHHQQSPKTGLYMKPEEGNVYTTLEPTLSSNPNVFFHRGGINTGMMY